MTSPSPFDRPLVIVGGGPAGLIAALAATRLGLAPQVFEQAESFHHVGGGILIHNNGLAVLAALGLLDDFMPLVHQCTVGAFLVPPNRVLSRFDFAALKGVRFPWAAICMRHSLQEFLLAKAVAAGVNVQFGRRCESATRLDSGKVRLNFQHGAPVDAGVVVACDGIHSRVRESLNFSSRKVAIGQAYLRMVCERPLKDKFLREFAGHDGRRLGLGPLPHDRTYLFCRAPLGEWHDVRRDPARLSAFIESWRPFGDEVVELMRTVKDWATVSYDELKELIVQRWAEPPVFLVGDAAHAMTPNIGQGANSAMVDALVLMRLLAAARAAGTSLDAVGRDYERVRRAFVTKTQQTARMVGRLLGVRNPLLRAFRNGLMQLMEWLPALNRGNTDLLLGNNPLDTPYLTPLG